MDTVYNVPISLEGNDDPWASSQPALVAQIHKEHLEGGSDVWEANPLNGTTISYGEYKMQPIVHELNRFLPSLHRSPVIRSES